MNTGAVITAVGTGFTAIASVIVGWFVRRTDRAAKLTQAYMDDAAFNMALVGALRDDYWAVVDWAHSTRSKWHRLITALPQLVEAPNKQQLDSLLSDIGELPVIPEAQHRKLEREHAKREKENDSG